MPYEEHLFEIILIKEEMPFESFLSLALVAILCSGVDPFVQSWLKMIMGNICVKFDPVVQEEMLLKEKIYA